MASERAVWKTFLTSAHRPIGRRISVVVIQRELMNDETFLMNMGDHLINRMDLVIIITA